MTRWELVKLGQTAKVGAGNSAPQNASLFENGTYNFFRTSDIGRIKVGKIFDAVDKLNDLGTHKLRKWGKGTILFPKSGASTFLNHRVMLGTDGYVSSHLATIKANEKTLDDNFLFYFLMTVDAQRLVPDSNYPSLNLPAIENIDVPLPPLPVQKAIVAKLDAAFASIEQAIAAAERNAENAKQLFQSYLSDVFERGGEGWVEQTLGGVCKFIGGSQPPKSSFEKAVTADNIRLIQIRDYKSDKHITYIKRSAARRFCTAEDIMIGRYGPPIFQILRGLEGAYNVALMKAEPNQKFLSRDYLFYFLQHPAIQNHVINASTRAAGQSGMNKETIEPYPIRLPSLSEQASIVTAVLSMSEQSKSLIRKYNEKCELLNQLKQSLLQQAFNGQLVDA